MSARPPFVVDEHGKRAFLAEDTQPSLAVVPLTLPAANALVKSLHRHHAPIPGGFGWWSVGVVANGVLVGCAIAGRPTNRNNDDGQTVEVLRVATDGTPNAPSCLLGACAKAAKAIGARRIITYTLDSEGGSSLRGAGWRREADGIQSWWTHPGADGSGRTPAVDRPHMAEKKVRWGIAIRDAIVYATPSQPDAGADEPTLFSVDVEAFDGIPASEAAVNLDAIAGHACDGAIAAVELDGPSDELVEHERRVGFSPTELHTDTLPRGDAR